VRDLLVASRQPEQDRVGEAVRHVLDRFEAQPAGGDPLGERAQLRRLPAPVLGEAEPGTPGADAPQAELRAEAQRLIAQPGGVAQPDPQLLCWHDASSLSASRGTPLSRPARFHGAIL